MAASTPFRLRWPHLALALLVYLVLLLAWAPASVLAWAAPRLSQQSVWLEQPYGSVWQGGAAGLRLEVSGQSATLGQIDWRWRPVDLFRGRLGYRVRLSGPETDAAATLRGGPRGGELHDARAELSARLLASLSPDLALWQPEGRLVLEAQRVVIGTGGAAGKATLRWLDAASGRVKQPLGSYRAELEGVDRGLAITLSTESGALLLQGTGNWDPGRGLDFSGQARPAPAARAALEGLLSLLGPAQPDGSRTLRIGR